MWRKFELVPHSLCGLGNVVLNINWQFHYVHQLFCFIFIMEMFIVITELFYHACVVWYHMYSLAHFKDLREVIKGDFIVITRINNYHFLYVPFPCRICRIVILCYSHLMDWWYDELMVWWTDGLMNWWFDDLIIIIRINNVKSIESAFASLLGLGQRQLPYL